MSGIRWVAQLEGKQIPFTCQDADSSLFTFSLLPPVYSAAAFQHERDAKRA